MIGFFIAMARKNGIILDELDIKKLEELLKENALNLGSIDELNVKTFLIDQKKRFEDMDEKLDGLNRFN